MRMPPKWIDRFLGWFCRPEELEILRGDLYESYLERLPNGKIKADLFFILEVLDLFRPFAIKKYQGSNSTIMFRNYFKVAYRNFGRQRLYSLINVGGLAIGLACFILIFIYVRDELNFDRFHTKSDRIYRVLELHESEGVGEHSSSLPFPVGPTLVNDFPGIIKSQVRLFNFQSPTLSLAYKEKDKAFNETRAYFADSTFLDVFDFKLKQGNAETALDEPNSILLTESMAKKYFGEEDPIGKLLEFQGTQNLMITGILEDAPSDSHIQYDFIISFSSVKPFFGGNYPQSWYWNPCWTYILLEPEADPQTLLGFFPDFIDKYFPDFVKNDLELQLQALTDIHLGKRLLFELQTSADKDNLYIFGAIAIFLLGIATINFINLNTARASKRAKEVGVRKSLGSHRKQLIWQFIFESIALTFLAVLISIVIIGLALPAFNNLVDKSVTMWDVLSLEYVLGAILLALIVGFMAGIYPAFVLSSFKPVVVLKGGTGKIKGANFRRILVTLQFAISIFLIASTIVAFQQLNKLINQDEGFDKEHVLMLPVIRTPMGEHIDTFRDRALQSSAVTSVTGIEEILGAKHQTGNFRFEGMEQSKPFPRIVVLHDFVKTMNIELLAGRDYAPEFVTDDTLALVINEAMVRTLGWGDPQNAVGKRFYRRSELKGKVVGVVKDFNFVSKHSEIDPLVITLNTQPWAYNIFIKYLAVRINGENRDKAISDLEEAWYSVLPNRPFDFYFLEDQLDNSYRSEQKLSQITVIFSFVAIGIACLGLFGLTTFNVERRKKEIGLRKVLGIKTGQILTLLSKEFLVLILVAFLVSIPLTYILLKSWLEGFAYRIELEVWPFLIAGGLTFTISVLTVLYHAIKASTINPAKTLRYE